MKILVLNSGSSSQKSCLYEIGAAAPENPPPCLWEGKIEWRGETAEVDVKNSHGLAQSEQLKVPSRAEAVQHLLGSLFAGKSKVAASPADIDVVGHRVVHGGLRYE